VCYVFSLSGDPRWSNSELPQASCGLTICGAMLYIILRRLGLDDMSWTELARYCCCERRPEIQRVSRIGSAWLGAAACADTTSMVSLQSRPAGTSPADFHDELYTF